METRHECPFCYSANVTEECVGTYHCHECDCLFDDNDITLEPIRHRLSAFLCGEQATEKNPYPCNIHIGDMIVGVGKGDELELISPVVTGIYETYDGIILFILDSLDEPMEFDAMYLEDLVKIADELELDAIRIIK